MVSTQSHCWEIVETSNFILDNQHGRRLIKSTCEQVGCTIYVFYFYPEYFENSILYVSALNTNTMSWDLDSPPGKEVRYTGLLSAKLYKDNIFVFDTGDPLPAFDVVLGTWGDSISFSPEISICMGSAYCRVERIGAIIVFGGLHADETAKTGIMRIDMETMKSAKVNSKGKELQNRGMVATVVSGFKIFVFGGWEPAKNEAGFIGKSDFFVLDCRHGCTWSSLLCSGTNPPGLVFARLAIRGTKLLLFGGETGEDVDYMHQLDLTENHWEKAPQRLATDGHSERFVWDPDFSTLDTGRAIFALGSQQLKPVFLLEY